MPFRKKLKNYIFWIFFSEGVGLVSGYLSGDGIRSYSASARQPALSPPAWVFPVVWTILYALMGISAARISLSPASPVRGRGLNLFVLQLTVNCFWSLLFFNAKAYGFALLWLLLLLGTVFTMITVFRKADRLASLLQVPYLLWLVFAAWLNYAVWRLNT